MKIIEAILILMVLASCHVTTSVPYRDEIIATEKFLNDQYVISGFLVGDGPDPGEFYLLTQLVAEAGTEDQFRIMLNDTCPAVRAMGLVCLAKHDYQFEVLHDDKVEINALPFGCGGINMTLAEFSERLKNDEVFRACYTGPEELAGELINKQSQPAI